MSEQPLERVKPESVTQEQTTKNRKKAQKTAFILAAVALGFFVWSVFIVMKHAAQ